ncbi:DUF1513 domain-containing protein [Histidinibacterium aquaticum]|uniref:DUF1513 domain-containing protein n=1 Tax=Histidinibacterium aquaticum TaxID=2613962 RepID=A0A5J5GDR0_9RHOB|nr:DUF1513 domain-containing protein [Histidinibacterium aquaticum]KAA9006100.1 DUF1513 domain-containing protein [Histidinibacterium aquaticum]
MPTRRGFLASLAAAATVPQLSWADAGAPAFLAAAREADGSFALFGLTEQGADLFRVSLPDRGHAACAHPHAPEAVAFARRPGTFALVIDCASGSLIRRLEAPEGRHFYGHGAFLADGAILCTAENAYETGEGKIGLWSRDDGYRRMGEIESGGTGPHDMLTLPGDILAVANGGIRTHPDRGREKLNIDTMRPNLAYVSVSGGVEEVVELDPGLHRNSIRHLAEHDGQVGFAMQWQGPLPDPAPLVGLHRRGGAPVLCATDLAEQMAMDGYAGSIAMTADRVAITSPRGGRVHLFGRDGSFRASVRRADVCGVAAQRGRLFATDGLGGLHRIEGDALRPLRLAEARNWDNHVVRI